MKKIALIIFAFAFIQINAQTAGVTKYEKRKPTEEEKYPKFKTWSVGVDIGQSFTMMDLYSSEGIDKGPWQDLHASRGVDLGASVKAEKWFSTYFGVQGQYAYQQMSGTKKEYGFRTPSHRVNLSLMLNLNGVGGANTNKLRKQAWIVHGGIGALVNQPEMWTFHDEDNPGTPLDQPIYLYTLRGDGFSKYGDPETNENWTDHNYGNIGLEWRWRFAEYWDLNIKTQAMFFFGDNVDGSQTLEDNEVNVRNSVPKYFPNTNSDVSLYSSVGINWYFGSKKVKGSDVIIYSNPMNELESRVVIVESGLEKIMEDGDNDGVSDYFDKDPETPEGYIVDGAGVSQDTDKDGIPDELDEDPFSTKGAQVDAKGREYDQDSDGVPDARDLEKNTPVGQLVNFQGVSIKDRIGGSAGNDSYFLPSVYFDFNKTVATTQNYQRLAVIANYMKANPDVKLEVVGHADPKGTESYNTNLAQRRAVEVVNALVNDFDMDANRLEAVSKGESELISQRDDINRRVEFRIK